MGMSNGQSDHAWGALVNEAAEQREAKMAQRYRELAALPEGEMLSRMTAMVRAEYDLSDAELRPFVLSRLRTWLVLDRDTVVKIEACYDAAMRQMSGPTAMRRVAVTQTLFREFSKEDQERLVEIEPVAFGGLKQVIRPFVSGGETHSMAAAAPAKRGWWPFRKG